MKEGLVNILDRIFAVAGAFIFVQIPQFYQQYTSLVSGHLAELAYQITQMEKSAKTTEKTLDQLIQKFIAASDPDFHNQGVLMQATFERWTEFTKALLALNEASFLSRPFVFIRHVDWQVFKETFHQFTFGFSLTFESLIYAIFGIFFGYIIFQFFFKGFGYLKKSPQETLRG